MQTELSNTLGVEHAIFGFTPFPAVAAAISRAGGFGVLGAVRYTAPDELARDLDWMQEHVEGEASGWRITGWMEQVARSQLDVAFDYPIKLLANALGSPPVDVVARAHDHGILVAAL